MPIARDSQVRFSEEDSTTPTSTDAWTIAGSDRFAISAMLGRDFGTPATHSAMRISGSGGDLMTQIGTTDSIGPARMSVWNLYGSNLPATGSARTLYGLLAGDVPEPTGLISGAVYTGVHQTTPIGDSDVATGSNSGGTTVVPGDGLTLTLTTVSGDRVVGFIGVTCSGIVTVSGVTGVDEYLAESQVLEQLIRVDIAATGTSTVLAPTITFSAATDASFTMRAYVLQGAAGAADPVSLVVTLM